MLQEDHQRARAIAEMFAKRPEVAAILPVDTNIVIIQLDGSISETAYVKQLAEVGIRAVSFGKQLIRFVTHLDFTDDHLIEMEKVLKKLF